MTDPAPSSPVSETPEPGSERKPLTTLAKVLLADGQIGLARRAVADCTNTAAPETLTAAAGILAEAEALLDEVVAELTLVAGGA